MALELLIGCTVIALCALAGRALAMTKTASADSVRDLQEDLKRLRSRTIEKRLPAEEALSSLEGEAFSQMRRNLKEDGGLTLLGAWRKACGAKEMQREENEIIAYFFGALESLGRTQQAEEYERALNDLKRLEEKRRSEGREKLKLYTYLGALCGLCAVIFLV